MDTVSNLTQTLFSPESPWSSVVTNLLAQAAAPGGENPLAAFLNKK